MRAVMHHTSTDRFLTPREMAERDEPWLRHWAHRLHSGKFLRDPDELDSVVNAAIAFATDRYQSDKGMKFRTYALERIRTFILDYVRDMLGTRRQYYIGGSIVEKITGPRKYKGKRHHKQVVSLQGLMTSAEDPDRIRVMAAPGGDPAQEFHSADLSHYTQGLSDQERQIIVMYFQDGLTMKEIGVVMGISESRVCQVQNQALQHIRGRLEKENAIK